MNNWQDAEQFADRALEMYERGKWADAEVELRKALEIDPDQGDWHFNLGLTLERVGRDAESLSSFEQASRLLEDAIDPQLAAGAACLRLSRFDDAVIWLNKVLQIDPKVEPAWAMLVDAYASNENHDDILPSTSFRPSKTQRGLVLISGTQSSHSALAQSGFPVVSFGILSQQHAFLSLLQ